MPGGVARRAEQHDRAVAEQVVVAVDQGQVGRGLGVVGGLEEVALDSTAVVGGLPLGPLEDDRHRLRDQCQAAGVVKVQVGEHESSEGAEVDLLREAFLLLQTEVAERGSLAVVGVGIHHRVWMQAGVDEDALALGLDQVSRNR
jgi:hypothetical protein